MLTLVTSNPAKYAPFASDLDQLRLALEPPLKSLPEIQSLNFAETLAAKAQAAAEMFGRPVMVDDTGLALEAYAPFPGPLTATVLRSLRVPGLRRLLTGVTDRAAMECHLGCWIKGALRSWTGTVKGRIDLSRPHRDERMPLSDLFVPDAAEEAKLASAPEGPLLLHRALALAALKRDIFELHLETAPPPAAVPAQTPGAGYDCPFCAELENDPSSVFATKMGDRLPSRVVYEDEHFIVLPPLGQFMEGGLLVLTRRHIPSMAHLLPAEFEHLESLLTAIRRTLVKNWGVDPLIFEHGPAPEWSKGVCCVDHAHLNIFPARVRLHPHLEKRMSLPVKTISELAKLRRAEFGYLFVQENDGTRRAYDGRDVPTQLVRRFITLQLGIPDRWHWHDYLGCDELVATCNALKGQIRL